MASLILDDQESPFMYCALCRKHGKSSKDGVGQCTMLTVSTGEADQTSQIPVPQRCCFVESHDWKQHWKSRSVNSGRQFLVDINENFIYINEVLSWGETLKATVGFLEVQNVTICTLWHTRIRFKLLIIFPG